MAEGADSLREERALCTAGNRPYGSLVSNISQARPASTAHLRVARPSRDLTLAETFWRQGFGMQVLWRSPAGSDHDLLMLGWPEAMWHLELVDDPLTPPTPTDEDLLVLYLGTPADEAFLQRVAEAGGQQVRSRNPYWDEWGLTFEDPDGYRVVLCHRTWSNAPALDLLPDREA